MMNFEPRPEPELFDSCCRQRGLSWLEKHPGPERPEAYWSDFRYDLAVAFGHICAYTTVFEPYGTVDHFVSWDASRTDARHLAYEWTNYRFAAQWINSSKKKVDVLDPFVVQDDWFEISLPDLQLHMTDKVPPEHRDLALYTLQMLPIVHDERIIRLRRIWYQEYQNGKISLEYLETKAPLIARAERKRLSQLDTQSDSPLEDK